MVELDDNVVLCAVWSVCEKLILIVLYSICFIINPENNTLHCERECTVLGISQFS